MKKKKDLKEKENDNDKTQREKTQRDKLEISIAESITSNPKPILYYNKVKESICYGEFCEYIIPQTFKGIKQNSKLPEYNIPEENKFTNRDKNKKLPYCLPLYQIKKVYDNPQLVNIVLKAYSIFPKNFDKDKEIEKIINQRKEKELKKRNEEKMKGKETDVNDPDDEIEKIQDPVLIKQYFENKKKHHQKTIILYTPTPNKFQHINYDYMYDEKGICENCYKIYNIIKNFISNIDECTSQFKSLTKARDILLKGENLKTSSFDDNKLNFEDNLLFQEKVGEISLKKILQEKILRDRLEEMEKNKKKEKGKIKNTHTRKEELNKEFSYKMNVNLRLLKLNLVAEKTKNKFFSLLFNELDTKPDTLYKKLDIPKPKTEQQISMKSLRMHMGINSHIYNPKLDILTKILEANPALQNDVYDNLARDKNQYEIQDNIQREMNQVDNDLFLNYKNLLKEKEEEEKEKSEEEEDINRYTAKKLNTIKEKQMIGNKIFIFEDGIHEDDELNEHGVNLSTNKSIEKIKKDLQFDSKKEERKSLSSDVRKKPLVHSNTASVAKIHLNQRKTISSSLSKVSIISPSNAHKKISTIDFSKVKQRYSVMVSSKRKSIFELKKEKEAKLEKFVQFTPAKFKYLQNTESIEEENEYNINIPQISQEEKEKKKNLKKEKNKKKIIISSLFYNKSSDEYKNTVPYYYITSPLPKFNEGNIPISENPLLLTQNISSEDYIKLGKFENTKFLKDSSIFVYDSNTAVPYDIVNLKVGGEKKKGSKRRSITLLTEEKSSKFIIVVLNDFFDSYEKYKTSVAEAMKNCSKDLKDAKLVLFNFPGQSSTMFSKKNILNNMFYSEFLDRFLYFLFNRKLFDQSYSLILIGFGNGGNVALTYTSIYEKYWDFIHSVIIFNGYCQNDSFLNQSMVEILKNISNTKNPKNIEFFIKSVIINPKSLLENNKDKESKNNLSKNKNKSQSKNKSKFTKSSKKSESKNSLSLSSNSDFSNEDDEEEEKNEDESESEETNIITLEGYKQITKGYFFNTNINFKNMKTKIICVHSNQDSFISINNLNPLFQNKIKSYSVTNQKKKNLPPLFFDKNISMMSKNSYTSYTSRKSNVYDFNDLLKNDLKRKLIIIEGAHDILENEKNDLENTSVISDVLQSYLSFIISNSLYNN
jgi:hypothetical protein